MVSGSLMSWGDFEVDKHAVMPLRLHNSMDLFYLQCPACNVYASFLMCVSSTAWIWCPNERSTWVNISDHWFLACSGAEVLVWSVLNIPKCGDVLSLVSRASISFTLQCSRCLLSVNTVQGLRESLSLPCNNVFSMIVSRICSFLKYCAVLLWRMSLFQVVSWWLYPKMSRCLLSAKTALLLNVLFINSILSFSSCILQNVPQASSVIFYKESLIYNVCASGWKQIMIL